MLYGEYKCRLRGNRGMMNTAVIHGQKAKRTAGNALAAAVRQRFLIQDAGEIYETDFMECERPPGCDEEEFL